MRKEIGIYGGSFNPISENHLAVIKVVKPYVDELWVMPVGKHVFDKELASEEDRLNMITIALYSTLNKRDKKKIILAHSQCGTNPAPQSTVELMRWLKNNFDGKDFYVVIGSDNAEIIDKWHDCEALLKENKFIIVKRDMDFKPNPNWFNKNNLLKVIDMRSNYHKSSTEVRDMISKGEVWEAKQYCPAKVVDYAVEYNLYPSKKILKVGLDYHGICDLYPEIFSALSASLIKVGQEVHIITGKTNNQELIDKLAEYGIKYTCIFSITDWLESNGQVPTIDEKGGKVFKLDLWNNAKADYCRRKKIDLMMDDSNIYGKYFTTPYLQMKK